MLFFKQYESVQAVEAMKAMFFIGPIALILAGALFYWGTINPEGRGYGSQILFLLSLSMISGFATLKWAQSRVLRATAWACIGIPIILNDA